MELDIFSNKLLIDFPNNNISNNNYFLNSAALFLVRYFYILK